MAASKAGTVQKQLMGLMNAESERAFAVGHEVGHIAATPAHIRERYEHRAFLDTKSQSGYVAALTRLLSRPQHISAVSSGIFLDKLEGLRRKGAPATQAPSAVRYLLAGVPTRQR